MRAVTGILARPKFTSLMPVKSLFLWIRGTLRCSQQYVLLLKRCSHG